MHANADVTTLAIERAAFEAWPAAEVQPLGGWRLRHNRGVTNRGNSVWPGPGAGPGLDERLEIVEAFYRSRGLPALFQLTPVAEPAALDEALESRGYASFSPVLVQTLELDATTRRFDSGRDDRVATRASCEDTPSPEWLELSTLRGRYTGSDGLVLRAMLERLTGRAGYALSTGEEGPAAVGLCVVAPPWAGVFAMRTLDAQRGRGHGRAVLGAIAAWARRRGATRLYLQVEEDNPAACALYASSGFATAYGYHYRRKSNAEELAAG